MQCAYGILFPVSTLNVNYIERIIVVTTQNAWYFRNKASNLLDADMLIEALEAINKAMQMEHVDWSLYLQRAQVYMEMRNYNKALLDYTSAIQLVPDNSNLYEYRGSAFQIQGQVDKAIDDFSKAIELAKENFAPLYSFRSHLYTESGNWDMAIDDLNKAIELVSDSFVYYFSRAKLFYRIAKTEKALNDLEMAYSLTKEGSSEQEAIKLFKEKIKNS